MSAKIISILNMKGGVGKTTIAAHLFRVYYFNFARRVLLIDLDAQFNLTQCIIGQRLYDECVEDSYTVLSCFEPSPAGDFFAVKKSIDLPPDAESVTVRMKSSLAGATLDL